MQTEPHHRNRLISLLVAACLLTTLAASAALAQDDLELPDLGASEALPYVEGQVVVRLSGSWLAWGEFGDMFDSAQVCKMQSSETYLLQFDDTVNTVELAQQIQSQEGVVYAHPNYKVDSLHPGQGSNPFGDDDGSGSYFKQGAAALLDLASTQIIGTGKQIKVAIIDSGIDYYHPLFGLAWSEFGYDYIDHDMVPLDEPGGPVSGHGSFAAGIVHLVAPDAILFAYRVIDTSGSGDGFTLARAIERAVHDGCDVINVSLVLTNRHLAVRDAIEYADKQNVPVVAAAGNTGCSDDEIIYPAGEAKAIAVAAVDSLSNLTDFSSFGDYVAFCAPGDSIYSAFAGDPCFCPGDSCLFAWWSGTSFAAPFLTGQLALMKDLWPQASINQLLSTCEATATDNSVFVSCLAPPDWPGDRLINPLKACIEAKISAIAETQPNGDDFAVITPNQIHLTWELGQLGAPVTAKAWLLSTNAPAPFATVGETSQSGFVTLRTPSGTTNDTIVAVIEPYVITQAGLHTDSIFFAVEGVPDPVAMGIFVEIVGQDSTGSNPDDTCSVTPSSIYFTTEEGSADSIFCRYVSVFSSNAPALIDIMVLGGSSSFVSVAIPIVPYETNAIVPILADPAGLDEGTYVDTVVFDVCGVDRDALLIVTLHISASEAPCNRLRNHPNPFNPFTTISFRLKEASQVRLAVYDLLGREVNRLLDAQLPAGEHHIMWDGTAKNGQRVASGVYYYRLQAGQRVETRKMMLIK
jgi:subtilisin family serine protease